MLYNVANEHPQALLLTNCVAFPATLAEAEERLNASRMSKKGDNF
jgi:hypothetical protein